MLVNTMGPRSGTRCFPELWPQGRSTESKQIQPRASLLGSLREDMGQTALWRGERPFSQCGLKADSTEIIRRTCEIYIFLALHLKFRVTGKLHTKDLQISSH